jgi:hypothetical protein
MADVDVVEVRLFLEELVCNLARFVHQTRDGVAPGAVRVTREVKLGVPTAFADVVIHPPGAAPYLIEVDHGYNAERMAESLYQFLGDAVIGLFGIPERGAGHAERAVACAKSLLMIAESVSNEWQRQLDRVQAVRGGHVGVAIGDLQLLPLSPFSTRFLGLIGDAINMAARLSTVARPGQMVVSNRVYRELSAETRRGFRECAPFEARNVGVIKGWLHDTAQAQERAAV